MDTWTSVRSATTAPWLARVGLVGLALGIVASPARVESQTTTRVSVATGGVQSAGDAWFAGVSADARYVAFQSDADDLVAGDTNGATDVFVHDRLTATTTRVSVGSAGAQGTFDSLEPAVDADARLVAFSSFAPDLVAGDTNGASDIFVRDRQTGTTARISVAAGGVEAAGHSFSPSISADGRYVSFWSAAPNLVAGDTNDNWDVFVYDRHTGSTTRINLAGGGRQTQGDTQSGPPSPLSADGRFVLYSSAAPDLVAGDDNHVGDVFVHDRQTGTTTRVSAPASPLEGSGGGTGWSISADGRYVAFSSVWSGLVPGHSNTTGDVFVHDRSSGTTTFVGARESGPAMLSADGRFVVFFSLAGSLVPDDTNLTWDVFVQDRLTGTMARASVGPAGIQADGMSLFPAISANGRFIAFSSAATNLVAGDTNGAIDVFVHDLDADGDGLLAPWETAFGLDPLAGAGSDGADGDADGDGRTNAQEQADGTHPRGLYTRHLAEGATSSLFDTRVALLGTGRTSTSVLLRFQKGDGTTAARVVTPDGVVRATVDARAVPGLSTAEFATVVESDGPVLADRLMTWDASGYGSHAETSLAAPSTTWYLAEGATHHNFSLFYLVQNPQATSVPVTVTYLMPAPAAPLTKVYTVPAHSRFNVWVNEEARTDPALAGLAATDVSAVITAPQPILVERAMYLNQAGPDGTFGNEDDILFNAGHESAGVTDTALSWFLAEGATGPLFDEFILIANPSATAAEVETQYLLGDGTVLTKAYTVPERSRFNIWVNEEDFPGLGKALAKTAVSATLTSTNDVPVIVERAMWWPRPSPFWMEAHNSAGVTATGTVWGLAEGEVGGPFTTETYILIANTSSFAGTARVTLVVEGGAPYVVDVPLPANSRTNVPVIEEWFPGITGKRFGALIESLGDAPAQIVVERAMYSDANGVHWAAGTSATATRLTP